MKLAHLAAFAAACSLGLAGCSGGGTTTTGSSSQTALFSASLVDGPFRTSGGTVTAVNVTIKRVEIIGTGGTTTVATFSPSQTINLLNYQTTAFQLGTVAIPAGQYNQVRLILDTSQSGNTTVVVDGTTYPLTIPSATGPSGFGNNTSIDAGDGAGTSGIKVNVGLTAVGGQTYGVVIDFNAAESILQTGNGQWKMKPVLIATALVTSGSISGTVKNTAGTGVVSNAQVVAMQGGVAINSGVTDTNGNFQINALPAGSYTLVVNNLWTNMALMPEAAVGADGTTAVTYPSSVTVTANQTTSGITITD
jgi:hypothetical protein